MTRQQNFATLTIICVPDQRCIELELPKVYLWTHGDDQGFHEVVTTQFADDLITPLDARRITDVCAANVWGGITTTATVVHHRARSHAPDRHWWRLI